VADTFPKRNADSGPLPLVLVISTSIELGLKNAWQYCHRKNESASELFGFRASRRFFGYRLRFLTVLQTDSLLKTLPAQRAFSEKGSFDGCLNTLNLFATPGAGAFSHNF
jgi:hypothetical protein